MKAFWVAPRCASSPGMWALFLARHVNILIEKCSTLLLSEDIQDTTPFKQEIEENWDVRCCP